MRLPFDLLSQNYTKPKLFLCETDKTKICELETIELRGSFKFNSYSELTCTIPRIYTNITTGKTQVNPFYNQVEALRLLYLDGFGYFEIQEPEIFSDGIQEKKNITAYGLEYRLSQRYLEHFNVNTGEKDSLEVIEAGGSRIIPITLVNQVNRNLSLTDLILERVYDWTWGHIDDSLRTMSRQFEISRASVYDFIVQDICEKFNCYAIFDTINNKINLYAESLISKHIGDGTNNTFIVSPPYDSVGTVSIDSYKTTRYTYDPKTGYLIFDETPSNGARIEITDGSQEKWQTDVYVTFDNLAQEVNISYSAEDIKTVLTVKGQDDLDIREVNMGLPYIVDLSYYYTVDWMGQDLYDAYTTYLKTSNASQAKYTDNSKKMLEIMGYISYHSQRLSLQYSVANNVMSTTVGTYYVRGGTYPDYYYREVNLPDEYNASVEHYYTLSGTDLNEDKFSMLYDALQTYFVSADKKDVSGITKLKDDFSFMEMNTIEILSNALSKAENLEQKNNAVLSFFNEMWNQLGQIPLDSLYLQPYKKIQTTNISAGWNDTSNENYWRYYPVTLVIQSLENEIEDRKNIIKNYQEQYNQLQKENNKIADSTSIYNNFTHEQLKRLSPFLREDEYTDDNFIETDSDTIEILMKTKQELLECGRIELAKLCEPKLSFSMDMANIYALHEFEPIIHQFQLGNLINVVIRDDYIKRARLLAVDINFDDFSDFSCEFGELTNLRTPSSIHADLLANALTAGNSVASNQSYWEKGADLATSTDLKIQNGLLNAIDGIYNGDKSVLIDNHGILLRKVEDNGEYSPYQIWLTNNNILVSTDYFDTAQTGIGVFEVDGKELYGVLAKAVLSGYIESSAIVGGTINIGNGAFVVDEFGNVKMTASNRINGYTTTEEYGRLEDDLNSKIELNKTSIIAEVSRATKSEEELSSKININADSIGLEVSRATNVENGLNSKIKTNTDSITSETNRAKNAEKELSSKITVNANSITAEVTRAKNAENSLSSKININANAITSKVNSGDFGTLIEQNYDHVKIAWNNNSKYIAFEDGALNIYKSTSHSTNTLLMKHNHQGAWYYHNGYTVGKIGTNHFDGDTSYRGLVFDLDYDASYMCWAHKDDASDDFYTAKLIYHANSSKYPAGLHFECKTYADGRLYLTDTYRIIKYTDNSIGYAGELNLVNGSNVVAFRANGTEKVFEIMNGSSFQVDNDVAVDYYSDIDMHYFDIIDADIVTSSDARLKTNIQDASIDALSMINQIEMKEFDWIESGDHEDIGMIAQQLQTVAPDLVTEDSLTGKLSIKTSKFIPYLIKAIQQLSKDEENGMTTYSRNSMTKSQKWIDTYDMSTKKEFIQNLQFNKPILSDVEKVEVVHQPTIISANE